VGNRLTRGPGSRGRRAWQPVSLIAPAPFVAQGARDPEETAGAAHVVGDLLELLEHAQGRRLAAPVPIAIHTLFPGPPFAYTLEGTGAVLAAPYKLDSRLAYI
jgi:hypothetical protein